MADKTSQIKIFIEGNSNKDGISLSAYNKEKKKLDLSNKIEYGICLPKYIYDELSNQAQETKNDFVTYFKQALEESLQQNISDDYRSLRPLNDKHYIKIKLTSELNNLYEEYSDLISKLYKELLGVHKTSVNPSRPDYTNTEINRELVAINYYLGLNEFTYGMSHIVSKYFYEDIEFHKKVYGYLRDCEYDELEFKLRNNANLSKELKTDADIEAEIEICTYDDHKIEKYIKDAIPLHYCENYMKQKVFSLLIRKNEPFLITFNEEKMKNFQTHTLEISDEIEEQFQYYTFKSEELCLFIPLNTYNCLNTFKDTYSYSIEEIAYYFIYTRLESLNTYIKKLIKMSGEEIEDKLMELSEKGEPLKLLKEAFKRPYLLKKYLQKNYKRATGYEDFYDLGIILPDKTIDYFYTSFLHYREKNPNEKLDSDYMIFLLHNYINPNNNTN